PTAARLAIKEPGAIRHAEPPSDGRDPSIVSSHLDGTDTRDEHGASIVVIRSRIEVGFNSEHSVTDLPVVAELASPDEHAPVVPAAKVHAQEGVGHVAVSPGRANVAARIKSGPTEWRRCIDRRRRRIRSRPRSAVVASIVIAM